MATESRPVDAHSPTTGQTAATPTAATPPTDPTCPADCACHRTYWTPCTVLGGCATAGCRDPEPYADGYCYRGLACTQYARPFRHPARVPEGAYFCDGDIWQLAAALRLLPATHDAMLALPAPRPTRPSRARTTASSAAASEPHVLAARIRHLVTTCESALHRSLGTTPPPCDTPGDAVRQATTYLTFRLRKFLRLEAIGVQDPAAAGVTVPPWQVLLHLDALGSAAGKLIRQTPQPPRCPTSCACHRRPWTPCSTLGGCAAAGCPAPVPYDPRRCHLGQRCAEYDNTLDEPAAVRPDAYYCDSDYRILRHEIRLLLYAYIDLDAQLVPTMSTAFDSQPGGNSDGLALPLNAAAEALQAEIHHVLTTWETVLHEAYGTDPRHRHSRGAAVQQALDTLVPNLHQLARFGPTTVYPRSLDDDPVAVPGWQAVRQLYQLRQRAQAALGRTRRTFRVAGNCVTCGAYALQRAEPDHPGDEPPVRCTRCGWNHPYSDYLHYQTTLRWTLRVDGSCSACGRSDSLYRRTPGGPDTNSPVECNHCPNTRSWASYQAYTSTGLWALPVPGDCWHCEHPALYRLTKGGAHRVDPISCTDCGRSRPLADYDTYQRTATWPPLGTGA